MQSIKPAFLVSLPNLGGGPAAEGHAPHSSGAFKAEQFLAALGIPHLDLTLIQLGLLVIVAAAKGAARKLSTMLRQPSVIPGTSPWRLAKRPNCL